MCVSLCASAGSICPGWSGHAEKVVTRLPALFHALKSIIFHIDIKNIQKKKPIIEIQEIT